MRRLLLALSCAIVLASCSQPQKAETAPEPPAKKPVMAAEPKNAEDAMKLAAIPIYPGASGGGSGFVLSPVQDGQRRMAATLQSKDDVSKVVGFYAKQMRVEPLKEGEKVQIVGKTANGSDAILFFEPAKPGTKITVRGILYVRP